MPRDPIGEKRPTDVIGNAVHVMKILTGEIEDATPDDGKNPAAVALGGRAGKHGRKAFRRGKRKEIAKKAAKARWGS